MMHGLKRIFEQFNGSENSPSLEQIATLARGRLFEELNFSPFKTFERPESNRTETRAQPRNLFADPAPRPTTKQN
jgi:hypothetical protein